MQRSTMQDAISAPQVGGIVRFTGFILKGIVIIELLGAAIMAPVFIRDYGFGEGLWMAVFHSISAFCNAGFDIVNDGILFNSLMGYAANPIIKSGNHATDYHRRTWIFDLERYLHQRHPHKAIPYAKQSYPYCYLRIDTDSNGLLLLFRTGTSSVCRTLLGSLVPSCYAENSRL